MPVKQRRSVEYRLNDIFRSIDVWRADNLHISVVVGVHLGHDCRHVLIYVGCKYSLYQENMVPAFNSFEYAEIVDIPVTVEVEVRKHIGGVVQQHLEFFHGRRLAECSSHSLKVKVEADVIVRCIYMRGGRHGPCSRERDGCGIRGSAAYVR